MAFSSFEVTFCQFSKPAPAAAPPHAQPSANFMANNGARTLVNFKDLLFFKESNDSKIDDCYFDQSWKVPAAEITILKASGVIMVNEK